MFDLVIHNARICDGSGRPSYNGAVGVDGGRIVAMGAIDGSRGRVSIDAGGQVLAPGFIDCHTHFDAQLTWDGLATPSLEHGITTIVPGNCSLSLAPIRAKHRTIMAETFRKIEEMPRNAFDAGLKWTWETFEEYLDEVRAQGLGINLAPLVGHSTIRLWVMDIDARERAATPAEIARMQDLLRECMKAGAIGLSTSWVDTDHEMQAVPSRFATLEELDALCAVVGEYKGVLQVVPEFHDLDILAVRIDIMAEISIKYDITTTFSPLFESDATPEMSDRALDRIRLQAARGARVVPQMQTRPINFTFDLDEPTLIFIGRADWWRTLCLTHEERLAALRDPAQRAVLEDDLRRDATPIALLLRTGDFFVSNVTLEKNKELVGLTLNEVAALRGGDAASAMIDLALEEDLKTSFRTEACGHNNSEKIGRLFADPLMQVGASDNGAHVTRFATDGDPAYLISHFVNKIGSFSLETAVHKLTYDVAQRWNIPKRGLLSPGYAADMVLFDPDTIGRGPEHPINDLPAAGYRFVRTPTGIDTVWVNGRRAYSAASGYDVRDAGVLTQLVGAAA